jgi:hypothetical protein
MCVLVNVRRDRLNEPAILSVIQSYEGLRGVRVIGNKSRHHIYRRGVFVMVTEALHQNSDGNILLIFL